MVLAEHGALRQTAEAAAAPATAAPSPAVNLKRPAAAVAAAPSAASKKVARQPAAKEAIDDVAKLLEDLELRGYCVQRGVVPQEVAKQAAELVQSSVAAKQSC